MDVPIGAQVYCGNELCGHSTHVILVPTTNKVTHVVVEQEGVSGTGRAVPIELLEASTPHQLFLRCSKAELSEMERLETESIPSGAAETTVHQGHIPPFELVIGRGAWAEAWDGYAGLVDEFVVDPGTRRVTHLVLREGQLWGKRGIAVPVSVVSRIEEHRVLLRLSVDGVQDLPLVAV
jgi:hypothetical protein